MAKKSGYSLFINFFFNLLKKIGLFIIFRPSIFTIHYFLAHYSLFIMKKGHYSLIIIPHLDSHVTYWYQFFTRCEGLVPIFHCAKCEICGSTMLSSAGVGVKNLAHPYFVFASNKML